MKRGGFLRSQVQVAPAAHVGALLTALPCFSDRVVKGERVPGFAPALGRALFGEHAFDEGNEATRFRFYTESHVTSQGDTLAQLWEGLQTEVAEGGALAPLAGVLSVPVAGAGFYRDAEVEKPQRALTRAREAFAFKLLNDDILALPREDQRRKAWVSIDAFSTQFVASLPYETDVIGNAELSECFAMYYGEPSPACAAFVGMLLGSGRWCKPLDPYGNLLTLFTSKGDGWRQRHDAWKWMVDNLLREAGIDHTCEVAGLFTHLVQQRERFLQQSFRKRQVAVPDFRVSFLPPLRLLADVKGLYCGEIYAGPAQNEQCGAVFRRQGRVHADCHRAARAADVKFNALDPDNADLGPIGRALDAYARIRGWVIGAFGEASPDVHELVKELGDIGATRGWRDMGASSAEEASAVLRGRARRHLGIEGVRGHARLKLDRLAVATGDVDEGAERRAHSRYGARAARDAYEAHKGPRVFCGNGHRHHRSF